LKSEGIGRQSCSQVAMFSVGSGSDEVFDGLAFSCVI
jgi:hypothetical protein